MKLQNRYFELENDVHKEFYKIVNARNIEFFPGKEFLSEDENDWEFNTYEVRNDITGNVYDVYVLKADQYGLLIAETENPEKQYIIEFSDFASLSDKINLVEEIQSLIHKANK